MQIKAHAGHMLLLKELHFKVATYKIIILIDVTNNTNEVSSIKLILKMADTIITSCKQSAVNHNFWEPYVNL